jgi:hypothetical protein
MVILRQVRATGCTAAERAVSEVWPKGEPDFTIGWR